MKLSSNFSLEELVHPDIVSTIGTRSGNWVNPNLLDTLESVRSVVGGPIIVNGLFNGQEFINSGLRSLKKPLNGNATYSAHYFGAAADCKFRGAEVEEVFKYILNNQNEFPWIIRMEDTKHTTGGNTDWLHIEVGNDAREGDIYVFGV